ncbi:Uncharacterised protein [Mycobacteroides abscessus subsp. abscessus]|nr:Uncharacterised protein [Mycobacteroides abscessus subsp. abscessus]
MEPIEINAGAWYLRALRADERMDDRPALTSLGVDDADYVTGRAADWDSDRLYSWRRRTGGRRGGAALRRRHARVTERSHLTSSAL